MAQGLPTLVYDGDCAICRYWVAYWQDLTGGSVVYRTFQEAAASFPRIAPAAFRRAIQLIEPDGGVYSGAAATFRLLRHAPGRAAWWWCYAHLPGFAPLSEWAYAFCACRRGLLNRSRKLLWGPALRGGALRAGELGFLAAVWCDLCCAFASLGVQILGLIGHAGILPAGDFFEAVHQALGRSAYRLLPSLFWVNSSDAALLAGTVVGVLLGLLVVVDQVDAAGAHRSVRSLPLLCVCGAGFHELPVGLAAARSGISGHFSYGRIENSGLALPLAGFSLLVSGGRRETAVRRPYVARLERHSNITSGRNRCRPRSHGMRRNCRPGSSRRNSRHPGDRAGQLCF